MDTGTDIDSGRLNSHNVLTRGDWFQAGSAPSTINWNDGSGSHSGTFVFWSVTGGTNGQIAGRENPPQQAHVGSSVITATAWYIETGGGDPLAPSGISIDAFDVNQGVFVNDDFVNVAPDDSTGSLTAAGNDGFVPTTSQEDIQASRYIHPAPNSVPFRDWEVIVGTETVSDVDLQAAAGSSAVAVAFYMTPSLPALSDTIEASLRAFLGLVKAGGGGWEVRFDRDGLHIYPHPTKQYTNLLLQFATGLPLADAASQVDPKLKSSILEIAANQVLLAADAIALEIKK